VISVSQRGQLFEVSVVFRQHGFSENPLPQCAFVLTGEVIVETRGRKPQQLDR